jgi:hypothetical protein
MANFRALETLRHAYRTLNNPSTSALLAFGETRGIISVRIVSPILWARTWNCMAKHRTG